MNPEYTLRSRWRFAAGVAILVVAAVALQERPLSAVPGVGNEPEYVVGTVRAVDTENRTLEIITGEGHAVRLEQIGVAMDCEFQVPGAAPQLASIKRGVCVRIAYTEARAEATFRKLAMSVEVVLFDGGGVR